MTKLKEQPKAELKQDIELLENELDLYFVYTGDKDFHVTQHGDSLHGKAKGAPPIVDIGKLTEQGIHVLANKFKEQPKITSTALDRVIKEFDQRGLLIDDYEQIFGGKSFDEILEAVTDSEDYLDIPDCDPDCASRVPFGECTCGAAEQRAKIYGDEPSHHDPVQDSFNRDFEAGKELAKQEEGKIRLQVEFESQELLDISKEVLTEVAGIAHANNHPQEGTILTWLRVALDNAEQENQ